MKRVHLSFVNFFRFTGKIVILLALFASTAFSYQPVKETPGQDALRQDFGTKCLNADQVQTVKAANSDSLRFVGTEAANPIPQPRSVHENASPEDAARAYLESCGSLFGIKDVSAELATMRSAALEDGRSTVRFQQKYQGIPVLAGEMIVQMDQQKNILAIVNKTTTVKINSVTPSADAETARQAALQAVAKEYQLDEDSLIATDPELWIYVPSLLNTADAGFTSLVWRLEVRADNVAVDELVLIDARRGGIALKFNQIDSEPLSGDGAAAQPMETFDVPSDSSVLGTPLISTYTLNHATSPLPGTLVCTEAGPSACNSDADAQYAWWWAYYTYWYYSNLFSRDSIDGVGMRIISTVHFGSGYANAFWNGEQMVYGDGFSNAMDVVSHELTHGVTNMESNLFYYYQSGAINESFSDVFGELTEKYWLGDADWLLGEDLSIGAIRDMANPPAYSDPDKMTSVYYYTGAGDNGGVHSNSGINNKAAYLMTDGGTFNGYTITGLGLTKVSKIYYEANTNLLTSGSDYYDLYLALYQACVNLSLSGAGGITLADCTQVRNATQAVEMHYGQPYGGFNPNAPICPTTGQVPSSYIFNDSFEYGMGNFTTEQPLGANPWYLLTPSIAALAHTGNNAAAVDNISTASASVIRTGNIYIPPGAYLHFDHLFDLENLWDGGVIEYSVNSGASWNDANSLIVPGVGRNYTGTLNAGSGNPLQGRAAFTGASHGYVGSTYDLSSLAGQNVMFRWVLGTDPLVGKMAWVLDDVMVYTCHTDTGALIDFNANGNTDVSVFRPSTGLWYAKDIFTLAYGGPGDIPVPADYNGDNLTDIAIFRPSNGTWYRYGLSSPQWGVNGDVPVPGDYNGNDSADVAVFRPSNGVWYIKDLATVQYGANGDIPVPGDYNGDGITDIAVFRPSNGVWYIRGQSAVQYGANGDIPVQGDYDGDGITNIAVFRPSNGVWYIYGQTAVQYGGAGDIPVPGDYNGNGSADVAVFRPSNGVWYVYGGTSVQYGSAGDYPLPARDTNGDGDPHQ